MTSADPVGRRRVPLVVHAAGVAVLLALAALWVDAPGEVTVDEGLAVLQARAVADGSWALDHPLEVVDPDGSAFPLRFAHRTDDGYVPFAKHPLYPWVLARADEAGGVAAMAALSIAGTVGAALAAAWLARRLDRRLAAPCLYIVALGSPLLFDANLLIADALGAAAVGLGAVALVRHHDASRRTVTPWLAIAGGAIAATTMLRGEGILLAGALATVATAVAWNRRSRPWAATAAVAAAAGAGGLLLDRVWFDHITGGGVSLPGAPDSGDSWIGARLSGLATTTLRSGYGGRAGDLLGLAGVLLVVAVVAARRGGDDERAAPVLASGAAAAVLVWGVVADRLPVPGLVVAFPLLWVGLALGRWSATPLARVLVAVSAVFALAVAATQYRQGGGVEWGARYVALALPLVVPVALLGLLRAADAAADPRSLRIAGGALLVVTLVLSLGALAAERSMGRFDQRLGEHIDAVAPLSRLGPGDTDERPIVVSAEFVVPQLTWAEYDDHRWLRLREDGPIATPRADPRIQALLRAGVDRFSFLTRDLDRDQPLFAGAVEVSRHEVARGWTLVVLEPAP